MLPAVVLGWDRDKAFSYLEARQQKWAVWKPAQKAGGPCISCHTGLSYLLAQRVAGGTPTPAERDLVSGVKARVVSIPPAVTLPDPGAEAVLNLWLLSLQRRDPNETLSEADAAALRRLWELQTKEGETKGSWTWVNAALHPFDSEQSHYFGTALAERALAVYPPQPGHGMAAMRAYLAREERNQPLHNRLAWIAFRTVKDRKAAEEVTRLLWAKQSADGGWTTEALGPWTPQEGAPRDVGSNAYATAWAAFSTWQSGVPCSDSRLRRALDWLARHQDASTGAWNAVSMNKAYPQGSIQAGFMTDAATGFAAGVLTGCAYR